MRGRNSQIPQKFRVSPVMTTSIPLHTKISYHTFCRCATPRPEFVVSEWFAGGFLLTFPGFSGRIEQNGAIGKFSDTAR